MRRGRTNQSIHFTIHRLTKRAKIGRLNEKREEEEIEIIQ